MFEDPDSETVTVSGENSKWYTMIFLSYNSLQDIKSYKFYGMQLPKIRVTSQK
jgi:hypothetical protein